jgi:septal ring factor EnvC (AmiA/AmiB activator)
MRTIKGWIFIITVALVTSTVARANDRRQLEKLESDIRSQRAEARDLRREQEKLEKELEDLREESIEFAERTQEMEDRLSEKEEAWNSLKSEKETLEKTLAQQVAASSAVLKSLQRLARAPGNSVFLHPQKPVDMARSAALMQGMLTDFNRKAEEIRDSSEKLAALLPKAEKAWKKVEKASRRYRREKEQLQAVLDEKKKRLEQADSQRKASEEAARAMATQATSIQSLLQSLENLHRPTPDITPLRTVIANERQARLEQAQREEQEKRDAAERQAAELRRRNAPSLGQPLPVVTARQGSARQLFTQGQGRGGLRSPVSGQLLVRFGERNRLGIVSQGISIAARNAGVVVAPGSGKVVFAGKFQRMGNMVLLRQQNGIYLLLAGLGNIDTATGRWLDAGEPLGRMEANTSGGRELYMEVRQANRPVDPLKWLGS